VTLRIETRGRIVSDAATVAAGEQLNVRLARGLVESRVVGSRDLAPEDDDPASS
jgi:hypothetical protein